MSSCSHSVLFGDVEQSKSRCRDGSAAVRLLRLRSSWWCEGAWRGRLSTLAGTACTLDHKSIKNNPMAVNASPNEARLQALATASITILQRIVQSWLYVALSENREDRNVNSSQHSTDASGRKLARSRPRKSAARLIRKRFLTIFPKRFSHSSPPVLFLSRTL